jgi:hypothetical protein
LLVVVVASFIGMTRHIAGVRHRRKGSKSTKSGGFLKFWAACTMRMHRNRPKTSAKRLPPELIDNAPQEVVDLLAKLVGSQNPNHVDESYLSLVLAQIISMQKAGNEVF